MEERNFMRRKGLQVVGFFYILLLIGCGEVNIVENQTTEEQLAIDLELIEQYRKNEGLTFVEDSATYPIQYTILEEGSGKNVSIGDIVFCHYIIKLETGEVVTTSIDSVAVANDIYNKNNPYDPVVFTFTETGWAINPIIPPSQGASGNYELGWRRGLTASLKRMKVGGHALIVSPSIYAYANVYNPLVPSSSVVIYEAYVFNAK